MNAGQGTGFIQFLVRLFIKIRSEIGNKESYLTIWSTTLINTSQVREWGGGDIIGRILVHTAVFFLAFLTIF